MCYIVVVYVFSNKIVVFDQINKAFEWIYLHVSAYIFTIANSSETRFVNVHDVSAMTDGGRDKREMDAFFLINKNISQPLLKNVLSIRWLEAVLEWGRGNSYQIYIPIYLYFCPVFRKKKTFLNNMPLQYQV